MFFKWFFLIEQPQAYTSASVLCIGGIDLCCFAFNLPIHKHFC